ncbi:hypothetical protein L798_05469 [Zootermopsis nevadensis]|uniref:Uncharacterized protein n=2 Tax=Zootermopsis nevadensis TaxID=136037 RepID=A0A067R8V0_ZOONE|nr:hypothetical protein L798_05469 [Zootermopsis nevadensis]
MRFTLRTPGPTSENACVKKSNISTWSKKEAIWKENSFFYKLFCTKKGYSQSEIETKVAAYRNMLVDNDGNKPTVLPRDEFGRVV